MRSSFQRSLRSCRFAAFARRNPWRLRVCAIQKNLASTKPEAMEIAAGAKIDQRVYDDANGLDFYQDTPEGIIVVNYLPGVEADAIVKAGKVDVSGSKDGFLKDVPNRQSITAKGPGLRRGPISSRRF